ncbi:hypothetical protein ACFXTH_030054 [Malus domestica]
MLGAEPLINDDFMDYLSVNLEDSLDLEERNVESVPLVELLVIDVEPSQLIIKDVLRSIWRKMGNIKVLRAKANVYSIEVGDEQVARRILTVPGSSKNMCIVKNARMLGSKIGSILEVEDPMTSGFRGFVRVRVDIDA